MRRGLMLVTAVVALLCGWQATAAAQVTTTTIQDTVYRADGTPAGGTVLVSWPTFTTAAGAVVAAGSTSATIGPAGALTLALAPNAGATPTGSYYTAVLHLDDGTTSTEYWVLPVSTTPVQLAAIESQVLPASVAMQTVSKAYVDAAIAQAVSGGTQTGSTTEYVPITGGTMTGPLILPADPVSPNQASDKHYVDTNVTALTGGMAQKVSLVPTVTQTIAQPVGTQLQVNALNGELYASQFQSGDGGNGIANALASTACGSGCLVTVDPSYTSGEPVVTTQIPQTGHTVDLRGGADVETFFDPVNQAVSFSNAESLNQISTRPDANSPYAGTVGTDHVTLSLANSAMTGGSNQLPANVESPPYGKSTYSVTTETGNYYTQGQHVQNSNTINCYGVGDCLAGGLFLTSSGGYRDVADEGAHPFDLQVTEDYRIFQGTCSSGCTTGSTSVMVNATSDGGTQGDGRYLIDKNPAKDITTGTLTGNGSGEFTIANFTGTSFPVSVFLLTAAAATSQPKNLSPGTVTLPIATSGVPTGFVTTTASIPASGVACVADAGGNQSFPNFETASYAVVDASHISLTLNKVHASGSVIAVGGLCGYGLEQTVDTSGSIRQVFPVVGSLSATSLYYASAITPIIAYDASTSTSGYQNISMQVASIARTNNVVTVTLAASMPVDVNGLTLTVSGVTDTSYDGSFAVTTTSGTTLTYADTGANSTSTGGTLTLLTGGFALYPMAEVLSVYDPSNKQVDGLMTLVPNTVAWAQGDALEEPHYYQQSTFADTEYVTQYVPRPIQYASAGKEYEGLVGPGVRGWSVTNAAAASNYLGGGGTHELPDDAYMVNGPWNNDFEMDAGVKAVFRVHCNLRTCNRWNSTYSLFALDSALGVDSLNYAPQSHTTWWSLDGQSFSFAPSGFAANVINAGTVNATTISGPIGNSTPSTGNFSSAQVTTSFAIDDADHLALTFQNSGTQMMGFYPSAGTLGGAGTKVILGDGKHAGFLDFNNYLEMGTDNDLDFVWATDNSGSYGFVERMRIKDNGNTLLVENGGAVGVGSSSPVGLLSVGKTNQFQVDSSGDVLTRQLTGSGASPTVAAGAAAGSGASATVTGTLISGVVSVTTGTSTAASAALLNVSWTLSAATPPEGCSLMPRNAAAAAVAGTIYTGAPGTSGWTVNVGATALVASTAYSWSYQCF